MVCSTVPEKLVTSIYRRVPNCRSRSILLSRSRRVSNTIDRVPNPKIALRRMRSSLGLPSGLPDVSAGRRHVPQYHTVRMHGCMRTLFAHTSSSSSLSSSSFSLSVHSPLPASPSRVARRRSELSPSNRARTESVI